MEVNTANLSLYVTEKKLEGIFDLQVAMTKSNKLQWLEEDPQSLKLPKIS